MNVRFSDILDSSTSHILHTDQVRSENLSGAVQILADLERFRSFDSDTTPHTASVVLVFRVPGYRSRDPGLIPGTTRFSEK
jgi:hypothetical protein